MPILFVLSFLKGSDGQLGVFVCFDGLPMVFLSRPSHLHTGGKSLVLMVGLVK